MKKSMFFALLSVLFIFSVLVGPVMADVSICYKSIEKIFVSKSAVGFLQKTEEGYYPVKLELYELNLNSQIIIKTDLTGNDKPFVYGEYTVDDTIYKGSPHERRLYMTIIVHVKSLNDLTTN